MFYVFYYFLYINYYITQKVLVLLIHWQKILIYKTKLIQIIIQIVLSVWNSAITNNEKHNTAVEPYTTLGFPPNCARQALGATYRVKEIIENFKGTSLQRLVINFNCPGIDVIRQINCIIYPTWRGGEGREREREG